MSTDLSERFARSMAAQDAHALKELLASTVNFRALTPGRCWESDDAEVVVDDVILGSWLSPPCSIVRIVQLEYATLGFVDRVGYRFEATLPDGDFIIEQQAYLRAENDKISWLRILCSGFLHDD
jgi:hypothetical protein